MTASRVVREGVLFIGPGEGARENRVERYLRDSFGQSEKYWLKKKLRIS